ncbi:UNVERIFIED_CONTAM: ToMV resistance protein Tm-2(2) [Sesamum radiatum]|uniref:ToMV resistance protein Tm-2(2) n=1 Tax=Sesamum radiatum TaxID=300843 RepID=A0AAW2N9W7_SESRA
MAAAEAAATAVINKAVEIAGNLILETGSRLYHLQENISWIETQMRTLQSYLNDAESKRSMSHEAANLIINIRNLARDVEDILDTYLPDIESHNTKGSFQFFKHASCILRFGVKANSFALEIEKIKRRAAEIEESRRNCGITADSNANAEAATDAELWDRRKLFLRAPHASKIVGRQNILQKLKEEILSEDKGSRIISVVGPAGVGKTTVAKRVYQKTKNEFDVSATIYVSQEPRLEELLVDIAKQVELSEDKIKKDLVRNLYLLLQEKRFLIFLDDVWDFKSWDSLSSVLLTNPGNGSRIIVTSRYKDVGRYIGGESSLISLDLLGEEEGKELFFDLIMATSKEALLPELRDIGEKIMERCGGLPLAIVLVVGLLRARERSSHAWKQVLKSMSQGVEKTCLEILALSYQDLPTELKPLFLYFGMFPADHEIFVSDLLSMWIMEKLIKIDGPRMQESIVEANIDKLISRNLIQVSTTRLDGRVRSVRVHDLLHSLCIQLAKDNNFFCTLNKLKTVGTAAIVRRITCNSNEHADENFGVPKKVRSLLCLGGSHEVLLNLLKRNASDLKFLRNLIIEIEGGKAIRLPNEIAKLSGLSYLKLTAYLASGIPSGISSMKNLLTLEVISTTSHPIHIPGSILKMKQLQHLSLRNIKFDSSSSIFKSINIEGVEIALPNLKTLDFAKVYGYYITPNSFKNSSLRKLRILRLYWQTLKVLSKATQSLHNLEVLKLGPPFLGEMGSSPSMVDLSRYQYLAKLHLQWFPSSWQIQLPPNLMQITLEHTPNIGDFVKLLKRLSRLEIIKLKYCYGVGNLEFLGEHSLPQVQVLVLWDVDFDELIVDETGLPKLYKIIYKPVDNRPRIIPERFKKIMVVQMRGSASMHLVRRFNLDLEALNFI